MGLPRSMGKLARNPCRDSCPLHGACLAGGPADLPCLCCRVMGRSCVVCTPMQVRTIRSGAWGCTRASTSPALTMVGPPHPPSCHIALATVTVP